MATVPEILKVKFEGNTAYYWIDKENPEKFVATVKGVSFSTNDGSRWKRMGGGRVSEKALETLAEMDKLAQQYKGKELTYLEFDREFEQGLV